MKFKKENRKFYVNGEEFDTFAKAWAKLLDELAKGVDNH
jgi:catalase (peroxidase I)